jgi:hypothetical protein
MKKALLIFVLGVEARAGTIVAPSGWDNIEADTSGVGLFGAGSGDRVQIIYSSQNFFSIPAEGIYVTALRFRMDGQYADSFSATPEFELRLSTSSQNPNGLSSVWTDNIGADETVVLPRSVVAINSGPPKLGGPNSFSIEIPLPTQFLYLPARGNLLMDARVFSAAGTRNLDWTFNTSDGVSVAAGQLSSPSASVVSHSGLITQFVFTTVPEPSLWSLFVVGSGGIYIWRKRVTS